MKRVVIVALLAFLSIILVNNVKATASVLEITSTPAGATVTIDGLSRGVTPLSMGLFPGTHEVSVTMDGYKEYRSNIVTLEGQRQTIAVKLVSK